jgi:RNA polymerase sigma-70 factor (ECF subfamily)
VDENGRARSAGGEDGLARLFAEHELKLSAMVGRLIGPRLAARISVDDVFQAAYLRARSQWTDRPPVPGARYCWLYGIVRNQVMDEVRKAMGATRSLDREISIPDDSVAEVVMGLVRSQTSPSGVAVRREEAALVRRALAALKPRDCEIITMRVFDDLTFPEIGRLLGRSENTVTQRYHRALEKLLIRLVRPGPPEADSDDP